MGKVTIKGIPRNAIQEIYDELYEQRIDVVVQSDSPRHDTYSVSVSRKFVTHVNLLIAKYTK